MNFNKKELEDISTLALMKTSRERSLLIELYDTEHKNKRQFLEQLDELTKYIKFEHKVKLMKDEV